MSVGTTIEDVSTSYMVCRTNQRARICARQVAQEFGLLARDVRTANRLSRRFDDATIELITSRVSELRQLRGRAFRLAARQLRLEVQSTTGLNTRVVRRWLNNGQIRVTANFVERLVELNGDAFSLVVTEVATIVEGGGDLSLAISVTRSTNETITLTLLGETDSDLQNMTGTFSRPTLASGESDSTLILNLSIATAPLLPHQRRVLIRASDGQQTLEQSVTLDVEPVSAPDIYLLAGQSNMEGSSEFNAKQSGPGGPDEPNIRILQLNVTENNFTNFATVSAFTDPDSNVSTPLFNVAEDPLHETYNSGNQIKLGTQIGLGLSFAKAALSQTTQEIILVPAAWAGTGFCNNNLGNLAWNATESNDPILGGTGLFDRAVLRTNIAIEESGGILRGILWHQGESDATTIDCSGLYAGNLELLVRSLRSSIQPDLRGANARGPNADIPFVLGTMSRGNDSRGDFGNFDTAKSEVDTAHRFVTSGIDPVINNGVVVVNDDLVPPSWLCGQLSCVHFGAAALREMGERYYQQLQEIINRTQ